MKGAIISSLFCAISWHRTYNYQVWRAIESCRGCLMSRTLSLQKPGRVHVQSGSFLVHVTQNGWQRCLNPDLPSGTVTTDPWLILHPTTLRWRLFWEICGTRSQVGHSHASPLCKAQICLSVHELVCPVSTRQQLDKEQINSITDHVVRVKGFTGLIATRCASWTPTRQCRHTASWYNA